ncbi:uncharacterized protein LOC135492565 [Lineus longissimus]|uniref:uncharacterized protein LOC135492565 n=1 Tax=Lineus longissimus TaxID=88925 RepID=UPI00315D3767
MAAPNLNREFVISFFQFDELLQPPDGQFLGKTSFMIAAALTLCMRRSKVPKIQGFCEDVVPMFSLRDFSMHFRFSKGIFVSVLNEIQEDLVSNHFGGRDPVSPEKQLLVFMWYIVNQESMRQIALQFDLSISTVCLKFKKVARAIIRRFIQVINWPTVQEQAQISAAFEATNQLQGVIGLLDGTHIELTGCIGRDQDYINRSRYPSMQLQLVVDHKLMIRNATTGWPGCAHDARVLRNSALFERAEAGQAVADGNIILADSAYPLKRWLITPFQNNGNLTREQRNFNRRISGCRQSVERAIGHLKGRMRRLKEVMGHDADEVEELIMAACILHNLCIIEDDDIDHYIDMDLPPHPNRLPNMIRNARDGVVRRQQVMHEINQLRDAV